MKNKNQGITLIALVITIIILLILAGVTISSLTGKDGMLEKISQAKEISEQAQIKEEIGLRIQEFHLEKAQQGKFGEVNLQNLSTYLSKKLDNVVIKEVTNEKLAIEYKGYELQINNQNNIEILGKIGVVKPSITLVNISNTTNTITVEVSTKRNEGGKIQYYYKTEGDAEYTLYKEIEDTTCIYEKLEQNKTYNLKIVAVASNGQTNEILLDRITGSVVEIKDGDITFEFDEKDWTNKDVTVTAKSNIDITGFTLQTSKDASKWDNTSSQTFEENGTIYVRVIDSDEQYNGVASTNIEKIDKTVPTIEEFIGGDITSGTTMTIRATVADAGVSGLKGYHLNTTRTIPTESSSWTPHTSETILLDKERGIYYLWVIDNAGNISERASCTVVQKVTSVSLSKSSITLPLGETTTLNASALPTNANDRRVKFISSDTSVATVSTSSYVSSATDITITAQAEGTTTITAVSMDGNITASCTVTVTSPSFGSVATYGEYVDLKTNLITKDNISLEDGKVPETDWRIFHKDDSGAVYLILADFLPYRYETSVVPGSNNGLQTGLYNAGVNYPYNWNYGNYLWDTFHFKLVDTNLWNKLLDNSYINKGISVKGAIDLYKWVDSWNAMGYRELYVHYKSEFDWGDDDYTKGYMVSFWDIEELPTSFSFDLSSEEDACRDTLFFPHTTSADELNMGSYVLETDTSTNSSETVVITTGNYVSIDRGYSRGLGLRPIVCVPSNITFEKNAKGIWEIKE